MNINFLIIGDPKGRRIKAFVDCLKNFEMINYKVVTWMEIVDDISVLEKNLEENTIVKLEPPEKDMNIYRKLLKLGEVRGKLSKKEVERIDFSNYQIIAPEQWYVGFKAFLENIEEVYISHSDKNIYLMNNFKDTLMMMDKRKTYELLENNMGNYGFYLPKKLEAPKDYKEFKEIYGDKFIKCFIKLRHGSGSTGILAYSNNPNKLKENIFTSLNFEESRGKKIFYSNYKINFFEDKKSIKELIDWVLLNGAHIERWIPKSTYEGYSFDTRSFVINKKSEYMISRLSKGPITNLHLRNRRMESREIIAEENLRSIARASEDVMKIFSKSLYAGIDVVTSQSYKPYIIDVNPFGDLFHNLLGTDSNVYYLEIEKAVEILRSEASEH